jgi:hypothetical protein
MWMRYKSGIKESCYVSGILQYNITAYSLEGANGVGFVVFVLGIRIAGANAFRCTDL